MNLGHLLLIEDNEMLGSTLVDNFQMENYKIDWIQNGTDGYHSAASGIHDLIILDVMLPHLSGFEILENLRKKSDTPVIILSAKSQVENRIQGLELKADDYIAKPFHFKELLLRIQSILKRRTQQATPASMEKSSYYQIGKARFDLKSLTVEASEGNEKLSEKEAGLIRLLIAHTNQVVSREKILDAVWGAHSYPSTRTIDNFIVRLRKWIEENPSDPKYIISHRGIGYCLQNKETFLS